MRFTPILFARRPKDEESTRTERCWEKMPGLHIQYSSAGTRILPSANSNVSQGALAARFLLRSCEASRLRSCPPKHFAIIPLVSINELRARRSEILSLAARYGARNVRVFGSVARGDDRADSDIDLLVEVEPGRSLLDVIGFEQDLSELLGRRVEVLTDGGISPYLQQQILAEAASL
jgi:hypothetical protein